MAEEARYLLGLIFTSLKLMSRKYLQGFDSNSQVTKQEVWDQLAPHRPEGPPLTLAG